MLVLREWLGGSEVIDLRTEEGYYYWATSVHQDWDAADEIFERLLDEEEVMINVNDPEFIERYTVLPEENP